MTAGRLDAESLVQMYLARIQAIDRNGPTCPVTGRPAVGRPTRFSPAARSISNSASSGVIHPLKRASARTRHPGRKGSE